METFKDRLRKFTDGDEFEIPEFILISIRKFFLPELRATLQKRLEHLFVLGTHAIIQTVFERILAKRGVEGTRLYLSSFVDGQTEDYRFSDAAEELHEWRNSVAHRWLSTANIELDWQLPVGILRRTEDKVINPRIFARYFFKAYDPGGAVWNYRELVSRHQLLVQKYLFLRDWLALKKTNPVFVSIAHLVRLTDEQAFRRQERDVKEIIYEQFDLDSPS